MHENDRLKISLLFLRITVFVVMFFWTLDKFIRPEHASSVYQTFYSLPNLGAGFMYVIGAIEMVIIFGFVVGFQKTWTYGLVTLFHFISTVSSFNQYLSPFESVNLLFFAAWPMLAGCVSLFLLRNRDTFLALR